MKTRSALGRLAWVALPTLVLLGPRNYACRLHPLAQLSREMEPGLPYEAALSRFEAYASRSGADDPDQPVLGDLVPTSGPGAAEAASHILFIQELWLEEDLQLTAWFGRDERLQGVDFTCR
ncbi:MAG TPA: hypothetical protein VLA43_16295 [Longimicrobiales bacterium]|nr:hypothetical protein [Longimicrobiales bacterium]